MNKIRKIEISIIIPVYNTDKYLEKCLESLKKTDFSQLSSDMCR